MNKLCLDTSAYSNFKRGHQRSIDLISGCHNIQVPSIVIGELRAGFLHGTRAELNESELKKFLSNLAVSVLNIDDEATHYYAEVVLELRRKGTPIPTNDLWIAAVAMRENTPLVSFDSHFENISRLALLKLE